MSSPEMVTITQAEFEALIEDQKFLRALEAVGVDNWEGYSDACGVVEGTLDPDDL